MTISADQVRTLREQTGAGVLDAKKALTAAAGDLDKAIALLRKQGQQVQAKKASRETREGYIETYVHGNHRVGVVVAVRCETDFVARNTEFQTFVHEVALQVAATNPQYVSPDDVPADVVARERAIAAEQVKGKPANMVDTIVDGKLGKFYAEVCLLKQPSIRDDSRTIEELLRDLVAKVGEKVTIARFARLSLDDAT
ncbi:MAG: elongation factor Ts [Candidatus Kerfeldbacteria bacterium]|nr:elongation factor Ts [Candidatus Kerfeldbacteria bacterium]